MYVLHLTAMYVVVLITPDEHASRLPTNRTYAMFSLPYFACDCDDTYLTK